MVTALVFATACKKDDESIVGKWKGAKTSVHYVNAVRNIDTTYMLETPLYGSVDFLSNGKAVVYGSSEEEHCQCNYTKNGSSIHFSDMKDFIAFPDDWTIKAQGNNNLTLEYTTEIGDFCGVDSKKYTANYKRIRN